AANLAGHDSHGVGMMPTYVRHLTQGLLVPNTKAKVVKDDGPALMFDGGRGYGRAVAGEAIAAGIGRCRQLGVAVVTLANAHHVGRVGGYGELTQAARLVSLHFVNVTDHRALVLPFGGHKGYALAVVTELLATALSGGPSIHPGNPRAGGIINNMLSILIDPARFAGVDWFRREVDGFVDFVKASPPADPTAPVLVPGDPERLARERRLRDGIEVDATTWDEILAAADTVGLGRAKAQTLGAS